MAAACHGRDGWAASTGCTGAGGELHRWPDGSLRTRRRAARPWRGNARRSGCHPGSTAMSSSRCVAATRRARGAAAPVLLVVLDVFARINPVLMATKLQKNADLANTCYALPSGMSVYEVTNKDHKYVVHLLDKKCDCRRWQLTGIPCHHAISCLRSERKIPEYEVHECYHIATYLQAYGNTIVPPRDHSEWDNTNGPPVNPPLYDKKPGRPRLSRKKQPHEVSGKNKMSKHGVTIHCSYCKQPDHNKKGCKLRKAGIKPTEPMKRKASEMLQSQNGEEEPAAITQVITQEQTTSTADQLPVCAFITQTYNQTTTQRSTTNRAPLPESTFISNMRSQAIDVPLTTARREGREVLKKAKVVRSKKKATKTKKK